MTTPGKQPTTGLLVEDHADAGRWLSLVLREVFPRITLTIARDVADARATVDELQNAERELDLALVDLHLPDGSGVEVIGLLQQVLPGCLCVVASRYDDDEHLFAALRAGAQGYLLKQQPRAQLAALLGGIVQGEPPLSPAVARRLLQAFRDGTARAELLPAVLPRTEECELTAREHEVLVLIAQGHTLARVAEQLGVRYSTVASHVKRIYSKLQVRSRAEATLEAVRRGLIEP